ncbi:LPS-assembly protein LptD [Agrobacterium larrymoorei]|uniref:LPS-assembly protein LptD n=1 Tax=Agrobacterium larrymoorei TaxID=160699 RepID=A0A4D7DUL1_9HYPH|nr:LPS-assembly protein LptD [Agrobacterium larrymoorei]QCI98179.1 LPS-assembly protein LptD [Agrobacterium larrymoorei]QYA06367.1 LPS-assembly protein LptD [Agrobacterium larrymoorei]
MAVFDRGNIRRLAAALLTGAAVCAYVATASSAFAEDGVMIGDAQDQSKLLLTANDLTYNRDQERVIASGGVRLKYSGYRMVAQRVEFNQSTGRVMARGNIELIEPGGNRIYADELDVTDNFAQGFVNALRVETTDNTRIVGESAERLNEDVMVLNNGTYTACLPCAERPDKPPLWQVKAQRVIQDGKKQTVRLEKAQFELFGKPIAYLPFITVPDNRVKRKSGFLFPQFSVTDNLGFGVGVPYYQVLGPSADVTITPTYYSTQGLLLQAEVRQRFEMGTHTLTLAGINQQDSSKFESGTSDALNDQRGMVATRGDFKINPRWAFGWDAMVQSDNNFSRTYGLKGYKSETQTNKLYLTGFGERNSFEANAYYFNVQDKDDSETEERKQAMVHPAIDYRYFVPDPVYGGELSLTTNLTSLTRRDEDAYALGNSIRFPGLEGTYTRLSTEAEWKRTFTLDSGLQLTPLAALRGDVLSTDMGTQGFAYNSMINDDAAFRGMATFGLEARYPILFTAEHSNHVIEPIAQLFVRNNEQYAGEIPNEDSQAFVFDATNLFERDKFTGYDRIEGGTRANIGFRYNGTFDNGYGIRAIAGQSFQLAGQNSFASTDLVNVGADSGLESTRSDYVAMAAIDAPIGLSFSSSFRFDKDNFDINRMENGVSYTDNRFTGKVSYTQVKAQPEYGYDRDRDIIQTSGKLRLDDNWALFGSINYDLNNKFSSERRIGILYQDECTIFTVSYSDEGNLNTVREAANDWSINARLAFRTLGDISVGSAAEDWDKADIGWQPNNY